MAPLISSLASPVPHYQNQMSLPLSKKLTIDIGLKLSGPPPDVLQPSEVFCHFREIYEMLLDQIIN